MMKILSMLVLLVFTFINLAHADNITNFKKMAIQVNAGTVSGVDFKRLVSNSVSINDPDGTTVSLSKPLCLATDDRISISHPYVTNPQPSPGLKIVPCNINDNSQLFDYSNGNLLGQNGKCLTREVIQNVWEVTSDQRICKPFFGPDTSQLVRGSLAQDAYTTSLSFSSCANLPEQSWDITLLETNQFQLHANGQCMAISGDEYILYAEATQGKYLCPGPNNTAYEVINPRVYMPTNFFDINMESCADNSTKFDIDTPSIIIEKFIPIVIPM